MTDPALIQETSPNSNTASPPAADRVPHPLVDQARESLRQTIDRYIPQLELTRSDADELKRQAAVKAGIDQLTTLLNKLNNTLLRVAVFGLVSRGKSAVLNALVGEKILETGPLNGVTQWPRSIYWTPSVAAGESVLKIELIDTPGLDEIEGADRGQVAQDVAQQADLILFVVAGDITRTEYTALQTLHETHKPLLLVFNKTDLYPDTDRQTVYANLQRLKSQLATRENTADNNNHSNNTTTIKQSDVPIVDDVILIAAEPAPMQVRIEWPDGRITEDWETPPPDIEPLKTALIDLIHLEGPTLVALNTLHQAHQVDTNLAQATAALNQTAADDIILQFAKYKSVAVALNPVAVLDLLGGVASDLVMIRNLAKLYGFPMTSFEASKLWQAIVRSSGTLLLSELGSGLLLGLGKSGAALWSLVDGSAGLTAYAGAMGAQAAAAGYGTYAVGQAARVYLEQGCSWGPQGIKTLMQTIVDNAKTDSVLERLQQEVRQSVAKEYKQRAQHGIDE
ncbi:small gtp-binding protein [Leptolyngbya sp. Heron Island J]|uniref:GTP-binding protein n=1 Tax=Leptolyngbya sp. Heron Island J TaxID=1385935 RepID=UPI0003B95A20|nr:GTP-binding protein [Leptolyngbya sp. Heron Island J]ESA36809.1 small gtp-binding protein [Leptolyngbya sp. Heron Island J]